MHGRQWTLLVPLLVSWLCSVDCFQQQGLQQVTKQLFVACCKACRLGNRTWSW